MRKIRFDPPSAPWSTNDERRINRHTRAKKVTQWKEAAKIAAIEHKVGEQTPSVIRVKIPFNRQRRRDPHNYCGTVVKAIIDGLVQANVWEDDTTEYVTHLEPVLYIGDQVEITLWSRNTRQWKVLNL